MAGEAQGPPQRAPVVQLPAGAVQPASGSRPTGADIPPGTWTAVGHLATICPHVLPGTLPGDFRPCLGGSRWRIAPTPRMFEPEKSDDTPGGDPSPVVIPGGGAEHQRVPYGPLAGAFPLSRSRILGKKMRRSPGLHQVPEIVLEMLVPRLPAPEQLSEEGMKLARRPRNPLKCRRIHVPAPPSKHPSASWSLYHTNCRCNTRSLAGKPLAGLCATRSRRIQDLYGMVVHVIRCNTHYAIDNRR